jgi:hypothetical protein
MELAVAVKPEVPISATPPPSVVEAAEGYGIVLTRKYSIDDPLLSRWFSASVRDAGPADALAAVLRGLPEVAQAYVKADAQAPALPPEFVEDLGNGFEPGEHTPPLVAWQGYLAPAPGGLSALAAWGQPGGYGAGVRVADVEVAFIEGHEALRDAGVEFVSSGVQDQRARNHGASVLGLLAAQHCYSGINGLCPDAAIFGVSTVGAEAETDDATLDAARRLGPGDVLLLELERRTGPADDRSTGYLPVEWWPDEWAVIKWATDRGILVVEAAGNGSVDLDRPPESDPSLRSQPNPFVRGDRDSGSIIVGAGAPPSAWGDPPDRARFGFSNYGSCVDAQGWGAAVATAGGYGDGKGDLVGGPDEDRWYTARFNGTSAAAAMVAGTLACVQGVLKSNGVRPLKPLEARQALRETGSPQTASFAAPLDQRIGARPDLRQLIPYARALIESRDALHHRPRRRGMQFTITVDRRGLRIESGSAQGAGGTGTATSEIRVANVDLPHVKGPTLAVLDDAGSLQTIGSLDEFADKIAARIGAGVRPEAGQGRPDDGGENVERPDEVKQGPPDRGPQAT